MGVRASCACVDGSVDDDASQMKRRYLEEHQAGERTRKRTIKRQTNKTCVVKSLNNNQLETPALTSYQRTAILAAKLDSGRINRDEYNMLIDQDVRGAELEREAAAFNVGRAAGSKRGPSDLDPDESVLACQSERINMLRLKLTQGRITRSEFDSILVHESRALETHLSQHQRRMYSPAIRRDQTRGGSQSFSYSVIPKRRSSSAGYNTRPCSAAPLESNKRLSILAKKLDANEITLEEYHLLITQDEQASELDLEGDAFEAGRRVSSAEESFESHFQHVFQQLTTPAGSQQNSGGLSGGWGQMVPRFLAGSFGSFATAHSHAHSDGSFNPNSSEFEEIDLDSPPLSFEMSHTVRPHSMHESPCRQRRHDDAHEFPVPEVRRANSCFSHPTSTSTSTSTSTPLRECEHERARDFEGAQKRGAKGSERGVKHGRARSGKGGGLPNSVVKRVAVDRDHSRGDSLPERHHTSTPFADADEGVGCGAGAGQSNEQRSISPCNDDMTGRRSYLPRLSIKTLFASSPSDKGKVAKSHNPKSKSKPKQPATTTW